MDRFSHPDSTVGSGISPDRDLAIFAGYTAGKEFHLAPKRLENSLSCLFSFVKRMDFGSMTPHLPTRPNGR